MSNTVLNITSANRISEVKSYYFARKLQQIAEMNKAGEGVAVINLGIGNPDLPPPPAVIQTLVNNANEPINGYQSYTGIPELKAAIQQWYKKIYEIELSENVVLPLMGSKEGIFHISQAFLNPGDKVLIPNPGYPAYAANAKIAGAESIAYPLQADKHWQPDFDWLKQQDLSKVKILWCNYPNMPTGAKAIKDTFEQLVAFGLQHNILIVHDNPYSFILNDKPLSILSIEGALGTAVELNSLSKSHHIAGWRIGMLLAHPNIIQQVLKVKTNIDSGSYKGIQLAAVQALATDLSWHQQQNEIYLKRKAAVFELNDLLDCKYEQDTSGMFVWAKIPSNQTDAETYSETILQKARVFITPGFIFGSNGVQYLRTSLCLPVEQIQAAIDRIKKII